MLNILSKVSSLPYLLAKKVLKKQIYRFFKRSRDLTLVTWSKGHVWEPSYIFCRRSYVLYLFRDPTRPFHLGGIHIHGREFLVACHQPESFVIIDILTVNWKKYFIKNMNLINAYCHWNAYCPKIKKTYYFLVMAIFYNFALKIEISWAQKVA